MKLGEQLYYQKQKLNENSTVIITHRNCPDGSAAAVIAKKMDPNIYWFPVTHHKVNERVLKTVKHLSNEGKLYVVDITCDEETLVKILPILREKNAFLGIYDHHETNIWLKDINPPEKFPSNNLEILFDNDRCGSKIFYDRYKTIHQNLTEYDEFIKVNNDRDLWLLQEKRSENLARFHGILKDEGYVERFLNNSKMEFDEKEEFLLKYNKINENQKHERLLKSIKIKRDEENFKYGVIYGEADSSNLLNKAVQRYDLEYAILINLNIKKGSIRSRGNKNCTIFAEKLGGGGHRCSSGFQIKFDEPKF